MSTAATGMAAQQTNLDVIANNLANVNTTGFKSERAEFQDLMYQTYRGSGATTGSATTEPVAMQVGLGSQFSSTGTDFTTGSMQQTGNVLDMAINGSGFFRVELPDGTLAYTRDGSFKSDSTGLMVTSDGYKLADEIVLPPGVTALTIGANGTVTGIKPGDKDPSTLGQITTATFPNPSGLTRMGQNLFLQGGASGDATVGNPGDNGAGTIQSGYLEGSNVQVVDEMVKMIMAQRAYEINSKAIQTGDQMLSTLDQLKQ